MASKYGVRPTAALSRVQEIDALRGLAALWVVLSHYQPYWNRYLGPTTIIVPNSAGVHAVEMFFLISGFVIFMTLDRCKTIVDFAVSRFSRLYPAYWAALLIGTVIGIAVVGDKFWAGNFLANLTMFQEFVGAPHHDIVFWSLSVEMAFYLNVAWLFALGLHRSPQRIVAAWLLAACIWALVFRQPADHRQWPAVFLALDFAPYFSIGIVFFDAGKWGWSERRAAMLAFAAVTQWLLGGWVALLIAMLIAGIFWLAVSGRLAFLVSKIPLGLGAISYALYLTHRNLGYQMLAWMHAHHIAAMIAIPLAILGAITLATLITYGIERPALRAIRAWYDAHRPGNRGSLQLAR